MNFPREVSLTKCQRRRNPGEVPDRRYLTDADLAAVMRQYILDSAQLEQLGYPIERSSFPGYAIILNTQHPSAQRTLRPHKLNVHAREFIPSTLVCDLETDSGNGSGSSVESSDLEPERSSSSDKNSDIGETRQILSIVERTCVRCNKMFLLNRVTGRNNNEERCYHHWGKLRNCGDRRQTKIWECCKGGKEAVGCTVTNMHVWSGLVPGFNGPFDGYVKTSPSRFIADDGNYGVYALDCEMCFTWGGLELAKVTVVDMYGRIVYDTLVKPDDEVIDYNTRFSGITANDLSKATKSLRDVQMELTSFIHAETVLIGHGLENDLRALKMLHTTVIDTCVVFPHYRGYPYRNSLKTLARTVLGREIQVGEHDSVEDASIVVDLMLERLKYDNYC